MKTRLSLRLFALLLTLCALCAMLLSCGAASDKSNAVGDSYNSGAGMDAEMAPGLSDKTQSVDPPKDSNRKIIKTFDISAETLDYDAALDSIAALVASHGGYVERASSSDKSLQNNSSRYTRYATYTLRIPAEQADAFVGSVGQSLNITGNRSYVEDISDTYYSIEARLQELTVERDSLLDVLRAADTKNDYNLWLTVKQRLSEVTQQIAVYQGQINRYDSKIAYSTVNLSVREVLTYTASSGSNRFWSRLGAAFVDGWNGFVIGLQDFVIGLAEALPTLCLLAILIVIVCMIIRARRRRRAAKKAAQQQL